MTSNLNSFSHTPSVSQWVSKYTINQKFTSSCRSSDTSCTKQHASVTLDCSEKHLNTPYALYGQSVPAMTFEAIQLSAAQKLCSDHQQIAAPACLDWLKKDSLKNHALGGLGPLQVSLGAPGRHGADLNNFSILGNTQISMSTKWSWLFSRP